MKRVAIALLLSASLLGGCTTIAREFRYPGGATGYLADERVFHAERSKRVQLFRFALGVAMASRMARVTIDDSDEADAFARNLAGTVEDINEAAAHIFAVDSKPPCRITSSGTESIPVGANQAFQGTSAVDADKCAGYFVNFDADTPGLEARVAKLMLAALPRGRARKFMDSLSTGNFLSAFLSAARLGAEGAYMFHHGSAAFRSGIESLAASGVCVPGAKGYTEGKSTIWEATECLGLQHHSLFEEGPHGELESKPGHDDKIGPASFHALMFLARDACNGLHSSGETRGHYKRSDDCKEIAFKPTNRFDRRDGGTMGGTAPDQAASETGSDQR